MSTPERKRMSCLEWIFFIAIGLLLFAGLALFLYGALHPHPAFSLFHGVFEQL